MKNKSLSAFNNIPRQAAIGGHPYGSDRGMGALGNVISGAPRQTEIMGQPHMLAYINPHEEALIQSQRSGMPAFEGPGGVPAYAFWDRVKDTFREVTSFGKADTETYNGGGGGGKTTTTPTTTTNTTTNTSNDDPGFFGDGGAFENWFDTNIYDVDGDQSGGGSNDNTVVTTNNNDSNNGLTNYTSMYDAIDAQGVGATVMINGVTMAAVAADGYIGNGQYDTTSSGATSGYTTDYADDTIVSTNTGQGYLDADGKFIQYGALDFDEDYTPTKEELDAAIAAAGGVNLTDDQYKETVDFTTTTSGNNYVDAAEDDGVTDEKLYDGNGGDDDTIVSTGTGQGYLDANGKFIEYGTDLVDDTELTDEDILMNMPVNVDTTNLNDFIILTQDGTNGNPITPVQIGETITSDGGKHVTLPEGIGAVVGEGGTRLIDETTGEVIGFLPNKTVQSSDGVLRLTIYSASTQALIDNANKILADQVNNNRFFDIAEGIVIADSNRDYSGGGDQNEGDLGIIFGDYELPDGTKVSIVTKAEYDALVAKWGKNALVKTESDETNLSAFGGLLRKDYTGYSNPNFTGYDRTTGGNTIGVSVGGDNVGQMAIVNADGSVRIADANGKNTGVVFSGVNAVQDAVDHLSISTGGGGTSGGDTRGDGTGGESGGGDGTGVDGTGVAGTGGGDIGGASGGEDGTGVDGTGGGDTGGAGTGVALTSEQVSTIVTDALALLPAYATPTDVTNAITTALEGMNDLSPEDVTTAITTALAGQKNLSDDDVETIINSTVGSPSTTTVIDGVEVVTDATGIYAQLEGMNNLSTDDVSTIVTDALALLPEYATPTDVSTAITNALAGMNNLSDEDVTTIVTDALSGMNNLSDEDVTTIVGDAISKLNNLSTTDVSTIVTDALALLPDYATPTDVTNAITTALEGMNDLSPEDVTNAITTALEGMNNLSDDDVSKIVGDAISGLNNISTEDVEGIVSDAISGLNDLSDEEVGDIITKTVGSPSTTTVMDDGTEVVTDATGIYAKIEGLNNLSTDDLSTAINDAIDELPDYATPADVTNAITTAVAALTTGALKTMQDTIDEMGRYETSEDFSVRDIVEEFKRQRKGGMGYGLPSYMQRYMSGNVIDELVREVVLPDGSKFFVTPDGRYLDPEEFIGSKTAGGVQYVSTGDERYQSGYSTLDTKTGVKTNYDMDGKVIGTSVQPESTLAS
jgi:hypothetical protein